MTFEEMANEVYDHSVPYLTCTAFREALSFVEAHDEELYKYLIKLEYNEAFGEG